MIVRFRCVNCDMANDVEIKAPSPDNRIASAPCENCQKRTFVAFVGYRRDGTPILAAGAADVEVLDCGE